MVCYLGHQNISENSMVLIRCANLHDPLSQGQLQFAAKSLVESSCNHLLLTVQLHGQNVQAVLCLAAKPHQTNSHFSKCFPFEDALEHGRLKFEVPISFWPFFQFHYRSSMHSICTVLCTVYRLLQISILNSAYLRIWSSCRVWI